MNESLSPPNWLLPATEIVIVGLPFSVFKLLTGLLLIQGSSVVAVGVLLVGLGAFDLVLNLANLVWLSIRRRRIADVCVFDFLVRRLDRDAPGSDLGIALDVFVSFGLVAIVIGLGMIARMPSWALSVWNIAVVLNVLGAGVGRLLGAIRQRLPSTSSR